MTAFPDLVIRMDNLIVDGKHSLPDESMRNSRIDFLRGVAIFVVLLLHFSLAYDLADSPLASIFTARFVRAAVINGNFGVTVFFVISGYLITSNNLRRYQRLGRVDLRHFYVLRISRILPPLLLAIAIVVVLGLLNVPSFTNSLNGRPMPASSFLIAVLSVLTFWHNVLMQSVGYFNYCLNIYWSLSVEEVFYLIFPIACVILKRQGLIILLCVVAIIAGPVYRCIHRDDELYFMYGYAACFDAIAFGVLTALLSRQVSFGSRTLLTVRIIAACGLITVYLRGIEGHEISGFSLIALCAAALLTESLGMPRCEPLVGPKSIPVRIVCWWGSHSYELYLFHIIVLAAMRNLVPAANLGYAAKLPLLVAFLGLAALAAGGIFRYYAQPLNAGFRARMLGRGLHT